LPGARVAFFPARWAWGDKVLGQARFVTPIPDDISDAFAAQLHVNPLTAALLVRAVEKAGIAEASGDVIVLTAAGSAVAKPTTTLLLRKDCHLSASFAPPAAPFPRCLTWWRCR
jgi:NADPH:quinone reductase-like Zn-dependent oxidoreductase